MDSCERRKDEREAIARKRALWQAGDGRAAAEHGGRKPVAVSAICFRRRQPVAADLKPEVSDYRPFVSWQFQGIVDGDGAIHLSQMQDCFYPHADERLEKRLALRQARMEKVLQAPTGRRRPRTGGLPGSLPRIGKAPPTSAEPLRGAGMMFCC